MKSKQRHFHSILRRAELVAARVALYLHRLGLHLRTAGLRLGLQILQFFRRRTELLLELLLGFGRSTRQKLVGGPAEIGLLGAALNIAEEVNRPRREQYDDHRNRDALATATLSSLGPSLRLLNLS